MILLRMVMVAMVPFLRFSAWIVFWGFYVLAQAFFRENIIWQWSHFSISFLFSKGSELGLPHDFLRTDQKLG